MDMQTISLEIVRIRKRLREIETEHGASPIEDLASRTDQHEEELQLRARLSELQDLAAGKPNASEEIAGQRKGRSKPEEFVAG